MSPTTKTQRWLDLIAFLASRRVPVEVEKIMAQVPPYAEDWAGGDERAQASVRRKFERDKDELRDLGIPIETVDLPLNYGLEQTKAYRLASDDFYLPYIRLVAEEETGGAGDEARGAGAARGGTGSAGEGGGGTPPGEEVRGGSSPTGAGRARTFELRESEARAALEALHRVAELPSFPFRREARSAVRKLTFDLEGAVLGEVRQVPVHYLPPPGSEDLRDRLHLLSDALLRRKAVRFTYRGIHRDRVTDRHVHPYGLLFQHSHWYLIGHDVDRGDIRVFRLGRMDAPDVNTRAAKTPDFEVPADFRLSDWADRPPWALAGRDDEPLDVRVRFAFPRSLWAERNGHGELIEALDQGAQIRRFAVQDTDPFLRWLLTLGGDARIESPPELSAELEALARRIAAAHGVTPADEDERGATPDDEDERGATSDGEDERG